MEENKNLDNSNISFIEDFAVGETVYTLNTKYADGTCLRVKPLEEKNFNSVVVLNDTPVKILDIKDNFALISKTNGDTGWIRLRNLTRSKRTRGLDKHVVKNEVVTPDTEYIRGMKLYGIGIKADVGSSKLGKGDFHLISPIWINDMTEFISKNKEDIKIFVTNAYTNQEGAFQYFLNSSHYLFNKSLISGFKDLENLKMATFLIMSAAEIDDFPFEKYNEESRKKYREKFYNTWLNMEVENKVNYTKTSKFEVPTIEYNLMPYITMERFGINSSLSALKYDDPLQELRDGFKLSSRVDSLIRHYSSVHLNIRDEDHIIHALWNLHAIYHNIVLFPEKNNLVKFCMKNAIEYKKYDPTASLDDIDKKVVANSQSITEFLKYDWNEGVIPPPESVVEALRKFILTADRLKWYPHLGGGHFLKKKLLEYAEKNLSYLASDKKIKLGESNLIITNGSDDALLLICHWYINSNKKVLIPIPTYEHFVVNAESTGAKVVKYNQKNFFHNCIEETISQIDFNNPDVVYLVSPNNPTGTVWETHQVEKLLNAYPKCIFVVDEAYYEFGNGTTCLSLVTKYKNVIVTRTASKAFCLASIRCGYLFAHESTINELLVMYNPKSVNEFAQIAFSQALEEFESYYQPYIKAIKESTVKFLEDLKEAGIEGISGGYGNFVCVKIPSDFKPAAVCDKLKDKSIYVRDISGRLPEYIRITIGLDMKRVVNALKEILNK